MYKTEQNSTTRILGDLRTLSARSLTCVKIEIINVTNTGVKLNAPTEVEYLVLQVHDGGASTSTKVLNISECSTIPASTTLGITLGDLDIYDVRGDNNINGISLCSIDNATNTVTAAYYTFS